MKNSLKEIKIKTKTSVLTMHTEDDEMNKEIKSLAILLGGYNEFGRHIDLEKYKIIKSKFEEVIWEMKELI